MNQQIAISPSIVKYIDDNQPSGLKLRAEEEEAQNIIKVIEDNYFVIDSSGFYITEIDSYIKSVRFPGQIKEFRDLFEQWLMTMSVNVNYNGNELDITKLAELSQDKIAFDPRWTIEDIKNNGESYPEIEYHICQSLLEPKIYDRLKNAPCEYEIKYGNSYDLRLILEPFLRNAKIVKIYDMYMMNDRARINLEKIINLTNKDAIIILYPLSEDKYITDKDGNILHKNVNRYKAFKKMINKMRERRHHINIENFEVKNHKDRFIYTNKFRIRFPCLDLLNRNGSVHLDDEGKPVHIIEVKELKNL